VRGVRHRALISFRVRSVEPVWRFAHLQGGGTKKKIPIHPLLSDHPSIATSTRKQYNACTAASYSFTLSPTTSAITLLGYAHDAKSTAWVLAGLRQLCLCYPPTATGRRSDAIASQLRLSYARNSPITYVQTSTTAALFHAIDVWITATPRGGNEDSKIHLTTGYGTAHSIG
jgi:hypothetical protein